MNMAKPKMTGAEFKKARIRLGLSQAGIAIEFGCVVRTISRLEGTKGPVGGVYALAMLYLLSKKGG
jgi:DNA-binding transcriptional regulator YiaG